MINSKHSENLTEIAFSPLSKPVGHRNTKLGKVSSQRFKADLKVMKYCVQKLLFPLEISLPVFPSNVFLTNHKNSFIIISNDHKILVFDRLLSLDIEEIDISHAINDRITASSMLSETEVLIGRYNQGVLKYDLQSRSYKTYRVPGAIDIQKLIVLDNKERVIGLWWSESGSIIGSIPLSKTKQVKILTEEYENIMCIEATPDNRFLVISCKHNLIVTIDLDGGREIKSIDNRTEVNSLVISRNQKSIYAGTSRGTVNVWSWGEWTLLRTFTTDHETIHSLTVDQHDQFLVAGTGSGSVYVWKAQEEFQTPLRSAKLGKPVQKVIFIEETQEVCYCNQELKKVMLWEVPEFHLESEYKRSPQEIKQLYYSSTRNLLIASVHNNGLKIWSSSGLELLLHLHKTRNISFDVSPDETYCYMAYNSNKNYIQTVKLSLVTLKNPLEVSIMSESKKWWVHGIQCRPLCEEIIHYNADGTVTRMKSDDTFEVGKWHYIHSDEITALVVSRDDNSLMTGDSAGYIYKFSITDNSHLGKFEKHHSRITALALSHNGEFAVSGSEDGIIKIHHFDSRSCLGTIYFHTKQITKLCIMKDNQYIFSASVDNYFAILYFKTKTLFAVTDNCTMFSISDNEEIL